MAMLFLVSRHVDFMLNLFQLHILRYFLPDLSTFLDEETMNNSSDNNEKDENGEHY